MAFQNIIRKNPQITYVSAILSPTQSEKCDKPEKIIIGTMLDEFTIKCDSRKIDKEYLDFLYDCPNIRKLTAEWFIND